MSRWEDLVDWADEVSRDPARRKRVALTAIVGGVLLLALFHNSIYDSFVGPFPIDEKELVALEKVPFKRYVSLRRGGQLIQFSELSDSGVSEQIYHGHGYTSSGGHFRWLQVEQKKVLVRYEPGTMTRAVEGRLREVENPGGYLSLHDAAHLMIDSETDWEMWALLAAAVGSLLVIVGLDQLRRAFRKPLPY
jgi:hypothetical protein